MLVLKIFRPQQAGGFGDLRVGVVLASNSKPPFLVVKVAECFQPLVS